MKAKVLLIFTSLLCVPQVYAFQLTACITGSNKLVCQLPVTPSILNPVNDQKGQNKIFTLEEGIGTSINSSFAAQVAQLPVPSATLGYVALREKGNQFGTPFDNLGPILVDRPDTVGKRHLFAGFSYQHFNFNNINGFDLSKLNFAYGVTETQTTNNTTDNLTYYGGTTINVKFTLDQYVALLTYGATNTTDVTIIVPVNNVSVAVAASSSQTYLFDANANQYKSVGFPPGTIARSSGAASGIGDVILSLKQLVYGKEGTRQALSLGGALRIPSGDKLNYLGSGAWGGNAFMLFAYRARFSPHAKLAYQWNSNSDLVGGNSLPGGLQYDAGADYKIARPVTVAVDFQGSQFVDSSALRLNTIQLAPAPPSGIPTSLTGVSATTATYTTANISAGLKWAPSFKGLRHLLLYGSVTVPVNNVGLRSDPVPLAGIAYNFPLTH